MKPPKKAKKKKKLSANERAEAKFKSEHRTIIRNIFVRAGFTRIAGVSDKEFEFQGQRGDLDDFFVFENIIVGAEYTTSTDVGDHLKPKKILFDKILGAPQDFLTFLANKFPDAATHFQTKYHSTHRVVKIIYCSRKDFDGHYKINVPGPVYLDYPIAQYFKSLSEAIKKSSRYELLHFLGLKPSEVGSNAKIDVALPSNDYHGSVLPEAHSHFDAGYKVVTFYADPAALLKTGYVLRKDGWRATVNPYQRMIKSSKIEKIREYLKTQKRVFINNIVVTLPSDVKLIDEKANTVKLDDLKITAPVKFKLPSRPNCVGIIDGQHRIFAYHETSNDDPAIALLRDQQNLLVTGIIFPEDVTESQRERFEARLFLEINSNQSTAKTELKQAIGLVLDPLSTESIATRVLSKLSKQGPLAGYVQQYFFEAEKMKTSSIISFGLRPLVKTSGSDSLYSVWANPDKAGLADGSNESLLEKYIDHCSSKITEVLAAFQSQLPNERWTTSKKVKDRVLTTTYINCFLIVTRLLIEKKTKIERSLLSKQLVGIGKFDFSAYRSSQYKRMAEKIVEKFF